MGLNKNLKTSAVSDGVRAARTGQTMKTIDISSIKTNPLNPYSMDEHIERLAASIEVHGLLQPLVVYDNDVCQTTNKTYTLLSGESRLTAIKKISPEALDAHFPKGQISVIVVSKPLDRTEELILIHEANLAGRDMTASEKLKRVNELIELYKEKCSAKEANAKLTESLSLSDRMLRKYKAANNVIPELKKDIDENKLSINMAAIVSQLPTEAQIELHEALSSNKFTEKEIKEFAEVKREKLSLEKEIANLEEKYKSSQEEITALKKIINDKTKSEELIQAATNRLVNEKAIQRKLDKEISKARSASLQPSPNIILSKMINDIEGTKKKLEYFKDNRPLIEENPGLAASIKALADELIKYIS